MVTSLTVGLERDVALVQGDDVEANQQFAAPWP
jgi:hypothetical protein